MLLVRTTPIRGSFCGTSHANPPGTLPLLSCLNLDIPRINFAVLVLSFVTRLRSTTLSLQILCIFQSLPSLLAVLLSSCVCEYAASFLPPMPALLPHRMATAVSLTSLIGISSIVLTSSTIRGTIKSLFNPQTHPLHFLALVFALILNAKSLPLIWHFRFFRIMIYQLFFQPHPLPRDALFRPIVTSKMYTPLPECDCKICRLV